MSLPRPGSGDDEVRKYGALIGVIAAIGTLIVVLIVRGPNGSDAEGGTCTENPPGRVPSAIICPRNATPENSKERDCIRVDFPGRHVLDLLRLTFPQRPGRPALVQGDRSRLKARHTIRSQRVGRSKSFVSATTTPTRPSFQTTVLSWSPGDTIPLGPNRTLQVVRAPGRGTCRSRRRAQQREHDRRVALAEDEEPHPAPGSQDGRKGAHRLASDRFWRERRRQLIEQARVTTEEIGGRVFIVRHLPPQSGAVS